MPLDPHINPASGVWDDNYFAQHNSNQGGGGGNAPQIDPVAIAKSLQQFQVQANQPAIQTLQGQQGNLKDQYSSLLQSVLGQGSVAMNTATVGENTLLGQRGITNDSPLYSQQMSQAQLPVTAQNQSAISQVGMGSAQDVNQLAAQIASLQTGNPEAAITGAGQLGGLQLSAQQIPSQIALNQAQASSAQAAGRYIPIPGVGVYDVQDKKLLGGMSQNNLSSGGYSLLGVGG